jgi:hypothetical protein
MGMPCEVNSVLKLSQEQGFPETLSPGGEFTVEKSGYRIYPLDVPLNLLDNDWNHRADVVILSLTWENSRTRLRFEIRDVRN